MNESQLVVSRFTPSQAKLLADIPGAKFHKGTQTFKFPFDLQTLQLLRRKLGMNIVFSNEIVEWVKAKRKQEGEAHEIQSMADAELPVFSQLAPEIYAKMRPDQRVGTKFLATQPGPLIADDPGLGKTWQVIASIMESGTIDGPNLVVCPKISITSVWLTELNLLQNEVVFIAPDGRKPREEMFEELRACHEMDVPFWLVVNWSMLTLREGQFQFPELKEIVWNNVIVDEAHLTGLANSSSQTAQGMFQLQSKKRIAMTGTPMGGKPMRLWGILHWLDPQEFSNQYQWADRWVDVSTGQRQDTGQKYKEYRGINKNKEEAFAKAHAKYILRRTKEEVRKAELARLGVETMSLPPQIKEIWVDMLPKQARQYKEMEEKARVAIEEQEEITGYVNQTTMLATYAWLKQFANGYCDLTEKGYKENAITGMMEMKYKALPTDQASPKLDAVWQIIQELDMHEGSDEKLLIFSQFKGWIDLVEDWLKQKGLATDKITGAVGTADRNRIQADFQSPDGKLKVVCLTTTSGGVSINLDMADNVIFMDETWNPDDQTQALNRAHRASRMHNVTVRYLRTRKTIEEDVRRTTNRKQTINDILLDKYRRELGT